MSCSIASFEISVLASRSHRVQVIFRKGEGARFLSHLDLMATLEYAVRRAELPVELSEGFNPHPRIGVAAPLALGYVGEREILEIVLKEEVPPERVGEALQCSLPPGLTILAVRCMAEREKQSASCLRSGAYRVDFPMPVPELAARVARLLSSPSLEIQEDRKGKVRRRDVRSLVLDLQPSEDNRRLTLISRLDHDGSVRPEHILDLLHISQEGISITRERIDLID